jgi:hypothetical protein
LSKRSVALTGDLPQALANLNPTLRPLAERLQLGWNLRKRSRRRGRGGEVNSRGFSKRECQKGGGLASNRQAIARQLEQTFTQLVLTRPDLATRILEAAIFCGVDTTPFVAILEAAKHGLTCPEEHPPQPEVRDPSPDLIYE